jgi:hypothetical protein
VLSPIVLALAALALAWAAAARAQALPPPTITIPRVDVAPRLSDFLPGGTPPGVKVTDFRQRRPKDLEPATQPTSAWLSYDAEHFYVGFVCAQPRADIRARLQKREDLRADDLVGVYLDTFHDRQRASFFFASPLGIQSDGIINDSSGEDLSFDTQWTAHGQVIGDGYAVLIAVPFKVLRFPARGGPQQWGVSLVREIRSNEETAFWPGNTERVNGFVAQFATAGGIAGVSPGRNIQLIPYGTFTGARLFDDATSGYARRGEGRAGLDVKLVPRDAVTLDFTLNPDFSQVESDEPQVTVNQRFEVFFPEKRPFFLENADFFASPITLFFSRRLSDPQFGARMTGKFGRWATGALVMDDRAPGRLADPGGAGAGDRAVAVVGAARREFADQSNLGFFYTSRDFGASSNRVGSVSTHLRLGPNWYVNGQAAGSRDTGADGTTVSGAASSAELSRSGRAFNYNLSYLGFSPGFRAPLGFVPRTDMHEVYSFMTYRWYPKTGWLQNWGPNTFVEGTWSHAGELQDRIFRLPVEFQFKRRIEAFYRHSRISETIDGFRFDQRENLVEFEWETLRWLSVDTTLAAGTRPNYFPAGGLAPFLGDYRDWELEVTVKPVSRLSIDETLLWSRLDGRPGSPAAGSRIFDNVLFRSRANYQFTKAWSLRAILDYNSLDPNSAVVGLERGRHLGADVLLTWLPQPGTAFYIGYTDGYDSQRIDPTRRDLTPDGALRSTGRQIFVKSSWLLRF